MAERNPQQFLYTEESYAIIRIAQKYLPEIRASSSPEERQKEEIRDLLKNTIDRSSPWNIFTGCIFGPSQQEDVFLFPNLHVYCRFYESCREWKDSNGNSLFNNLPPAQKCEAFQGFGWGFTKENEEGERCEESPRQTRLLNLWFGQHDRFSTLQTIWQTALRQPENTWGQLYKQDNFHFIIEQIKKLTGKEDFVFSQWRKPEGGKTQMDKRKEDISLFMGLLLAYQKHPSLFEEGDRLDFFFCLLMCLIGPYMDGIWLPILEAFGCSPLVDDILCLFSPFSRMWELLPITQEQYEYRKYTGNSFPNKPIPDACGSYRFCSFRERIFCHHHASEADFVRKERQWIKDISFLTNSKGFCRSPQQTRISQFEPEHSVSEDNSPSPLTLLEELKRSDYRFRYVDYTTVTGGYHNLLLSSSRTQAESGIGRQDSFLWGAVDLICLSLSLSLIPTDNDTNASLVKLAVSFLFNPAYHPKSYSMNGGSDTKYRWVKRDVLLSVVFTHFLRTSPGDHTFDLIQKEILKQASHVSFSSRALSFPKSYPDSRQNQEEQIFRRYHNIQDTLNGFVHFLLVKKGSKKISDLVREMLVDDFGGNIEVFAHHPFFQLRLDASPFGPSLVGRFIRAFYNDPSSTIFDSFLFDVFQDSDRRPDHLLVKLKDLRHKETARILEYVATNMHTAGFRANAEKYLMQCSRMAPFMAKTDLVSFFKTFFSVCLRHKREMSLDAIFQFTDVFCARNSRNDKNQGLLFVLYSMHQAVTETEKERERTWHPEAIRVFFVLLFYVLRRDGFEIFTSALFGGALHRQVEQRNVLLRPTLNRLYKESPTVTELLLWVPLYFGFPRDLSFLINWMNVRRMITPERTPNFLRDRVQVMMFVLESDWNKTGEGERNAFFNCAPDVFVKHLKEEDDFVYYRERRKGRGMTKEECKDKFIEVWRRIYPVCAPDSRLFMRTLYHFQDLRTRLVKGVKNATIFPYDTKYIALGTKRPFWEQELARRARNESDKTIREVRKEHLINRSKTCPLTLRQPRLGELTILCKNLHIMTLDSLNTGVRMTEVRNLFERLPVSEIYSLVAYQRVESNVLLTRPILGVKTCPVCRCDLEGTFFWFKFDPRYYGSTNAEEISPWIEENEDPTSEESPVVMGTYERRTVDNETSPRNTWVMKSDHPPLPFKPDYPFLVEERKTEEKKKEDH
uniref:Uncharacterized protein n=1 Tax=Palpitomonas bilix TaxID=652834 RepID=A0A7S3G0E2_9EUKA|mmetsp:Transcript_11552/g.30725  ORF Transcript_11552/g.30725 Transcript_11552/m.30725 type:complete len:1188 (+) Transcript_11552:2957-6520(+)|eukprot:CAMPEP_0113881314 /NCGR_PEP_ID=MMETSP0780_2-20120614/8302_1 /TAXON_ID=652834 /ORGANISM="Palpitomonas bilix" /LENGTH=1187 /DNA_ID=CAMNT_0000868147 /DNA_START=3272 /DNA_END=6835 /DNA_ORIENTATION=- /assembly_acc=CAM_ASM_000599